MKHMTTEPRIPSLIEEVRAEILKLTPEQQTRVHMIAIGLRAIIQTSPESVFALALVGAEMAAQSS